MLLFVVFAFAFAAIELLLIVTTVPQALVGNQIDPDSFTRLLRVQDLVESGAWFDTVEPRLNAPEGLASHWTRPVDVLIILGAAPLAPVLGWERGLYWAGFFLSPVLALVGFLAFAWAVAPLVGRHMKPLAMAALLAQPGFLNYALPGRADHHMLFVLAFIGTLGLGIRLLSRPQSSRTMWQLGVMMGLGLLVSVEFLITVTLIAAVLACLWIWEGAPWAQAGFRVLAAAAGVAVAAVLIERGGGSLALEYDRISVVHVGVTLVGACMFMALARAGGSRVARAFTALALGAVGFVLLLGLFPGLITDPLRQGDPVVWARYWTLLEELQPLTPSAVGWGTVLGYAGSAVLALPFMLGRLRSPQHRPWLLLTALLVIYLIFTVRQIRYFPYTAVLLATGIAGLLGILLSRLDRKLAGFRRSLARAGTSVALLGGPLFLGGVANGLAADARAAGSDGQTVRESGAEAPPPPCSFADLVQFLNTGTGAVTASRRILALPDIGPELAYRTPHTFVAAPYHRMEGGIRAALSLSEDESAARTIVSERGVDLVLICPAWDAALLSTGGTGSLYDRLSSGSEPDWLRREDLPASMSGFRLYSVDPVPNRD